MQPFRMSAIALLDAYRSRALSPLEVMRSVLDRVARFEPHIHATYLLAPERALAEARASEERWRRGEPIGPLDGVPMTIKDNIPTKGEPVPLGTAASDLSPAAEDAPPAARLREAGAIVFYQQGKLAFVLNKLYAYLGGMGVFDDIVQGLLYNTVQRELYIFRKVVFVKMAMPEFDTEVLQ